MNSSGQGSTILFFLIMMALVLILATNGFKIASNISNMARMRYAYQQELRLAEGLLTYGIHLCNENRMLLISWGMKKSQTLYLDFYPWPSPTAAVSFGAYQGLLTITSDNGRLYLGAHMTKNKMPIISGQCVLRPLDPRYPQKELMLTGWKMNAGG